MEIQLSAAELASFLRRPTTSVVGFRAIFGPDSTQARALGHLEQPGIAYATFDMTPFYRDAKVVQRSFALVDTTLTTFDLVIGDGSNRWTLDGTEADLHLSSLMPDSSSRGDTVFLHAVRLGNSPEVQPVDAGVDLGGLRIGGTVVLFHNEPRMNRSALSFSVEDGPDSLTILIAGVAPGTWQVWRNGWLEESVVARPQAGAVCLAARPGRFFLRRLD